jgi:hypothetical protein
MFLLSNCFLHVSIMSDPLLQMFLHIFVPFTCPPQKNVFGVGGPESLSSFSAPFSNYSFLAHHLVNRDDRQLLARGIGLRLLSRMAVFLYMTFCPFPGGPWITGPGRDGLHQECQGPLIPSQPPGEAKGRLA